MPKIIDIYILERKIGQGQFGEVFKGYNRITNQDIAVKVIERRLLSGKFTELLETEIKVLRTCDNENITKLYDLKKTSNNFYLILEYCNEGDLMDYLKKKKRLTEDEASEFLIQILNCFKTLVKNKILHRDFKLANILKHNGSLKIADFGFAKLLGNQSMANTMLGSPLNMAPEVLNGSLYNNKADIWSIGIVFYELLFGQVPFRANNLLDLQKVINSQPLIIPREINNISQHCEDVLRKMLVVDPKKRIDWNELFEHKIVYYKEEQIKEQLIQSQTSENHKLGMSQFYIKTNQVIENVKDIDERNQINQYAIEMTKSDDKKDFNGTLLQRKVKRDQTDIQIQKSSQDNQDEIGMSPTKQSNEELQIEETIREIQIKTFKMNSNRLLHERNIYVFLASVAEETLKNSVDYIIRALGIFARIFFMFLAKKNDPHKPAEFYCHRQSPHSEAVQSEIVGFFLVKKLIQMIQKLKINLQKNLNIFDLNLWDQYCETSDFTQIYKYVQNEYDVFKVYFEELYRRVLKSQECLKIIQEDPKLQDLINDDFSQNINNSLTKNLITYSKEIMKIIMSKKQQNSNSQLFYWTHMDKILDCMKYEQVFCFYNEETKEFFNFKIYYEEQNIQNLNKIIQKVQEKLKNMKF